MGLTFVEGQARGPEGREETVNFLVDSGAIYSLLPYETWQSLELQPDREERFMLADGTAVSRSISYCYMELPQGRGYSPVVLGEPGEDHDRVGRGDRLRGGLFLASPTARWNIRTD